MLGRTSLLIATAALMIASSPPADDPGLYQAMLVNLAGDSTTSTFVVQSTPVQMSAPTEADWERLGIETAALKTAVAASPAADTAPFGAASFPAGVKLVSREAVQALFRTAAAGATIDDRWKTFRERYAAKSLQGFSRPVITADGLEALIYYTHSCGSLCGEAGYAWLRRASKTAPWRVAKRLPKVIA